MLEREAYIVNTKLFIFLNVLYFVFDYVCIPLINPDGVVFGFIPFQMFLYAIMGIASALLWGIYFTSFFAKQERYDEDGNIVKKAGGGK